MKLVIKDYWNKVIADGSSLGKVLRGEYELKDTTTYRDSGWASVADWRRHMKRTRGFIEFVDDNVAKIGGSRDCGIHSYQLVSLEE